MPVTIKVMLNLGPENNYDKILESEDKMLEAEVENRLRVTAMRSAARLSVEEAEIAAWTQARREELRRQEAEQGPRKIVQKTRFRPTVGSSRNGLARSFPAGRKPGKLPAKSFTGQK